MTEIKCPCCDGTGLVTTDFVDDFSACRTCNGSGREKKAKPINTCPQCNKTLRHLHDTAYGIEGTHMAGTERFECDCGFRCWHDSAEAKEMGIRFTLDRTSKDDDELEELFS